MNIHSRPLSHHSCACCSMTGKLSPQAMRARLRWWLAEVNQVEGDATRKRVQLVAANAIGKYDASD